LWHGVADYRAQHRASWDLDQAAVFAERQRERRPPFRTPRGRCSRVAIHPAIATPHRFWAPSTFSNSCRSAPGKATSSESLSGFNRCTHLEIVVSSRVFTQQSSPPLWRSDLGAISCERMCVVRASRDRCIALLALLALLTPWAVGAVLSHHFEDHDSRAEGVPIGLQGALHGHWHPSGTPDHDHKISSVPQPQAQALAKSQAARLHDSAVSAALWDCVPALRGGSREVLQAPPRDGPPRIHLFCSLLL